MPFLAFLAILLAVAETDAKTAVLRPYLSGLLGIIGTSLLAYGIVRFAKTDDRTDDVRSIVVPVWLTFGTIPFLFAF